MCSLYRKLCLLGYTGVFVSSMLHPSFGLIVVVSSILIHPEHLVVSVIINVMGAML